MIAQGDIWWAELGESRVSSPGYRRPVIVVQCDALNRTRIGTVLSVPLTSTLKWANATGNVLLRATDTGLPLDSVANVSRVFALGRMQLTEQAGSVERRLLDRVLAGILIVIGR